MHVTPSVAEAPTVSSTRNKTKTKETIKNQVGVTRLTLGPPSVDLMKIEAALAVALASDVGTRPQLRTDPLAAGKPQMPLEKPIRSEHDHEMTPLREPLAPADGSQSREDRPPKDAIDPRCGHRLLSLVRAPYTVRISVQRATDRPSYEGAIHVLFFFARSECKRSLYARPELAIESTTMSTAVTTTTPTSPTHRRREEFT